MNCWEILGISPTGDQHLIKKAYAHAATLHHPEDDPDGFQLVYHAFKEAIAFAKAGIPISAEFSISQNSVDSSSDEKKTSASEQDTPKQPDFDTSLLQGAVNKSAEGEKPVSGQPAVDQSAEADSQEEEYDYDNVINRGQAAEQKKIDTFLETMDLNYRERKTLRSTKLWEQCFSSTEFLSLRSREEFTKLFLTYLMDHIDIKSLDWCRVFAPMLREWMYFWPAGVLNEKFRFLLRQRNKFGFPQKPKRHSTAKSFFARFFLCLAIGWIIVAIIGAILEHNNANSDNSSSMPSISAPVYQLSPDTELGSLLKIEDVLIGAEKHTDYSKLQKKCEELGVSREKYEQMQAEYAAGDKKSFNRDRDEIMDRNSTSRSSSSGETSAVSEPAAEKQGSD